MILNADINVGPGYYRNLKADELLVTSIFHTIQGEGPFAGMPAIFVRLAGCNRGRKEGMGCEFCDTKFTFDQGRVLSFEQITHAMGRALLSITSLTEGDDLRPLVVITGGEPMMQENLVPFISHLVGNWSYKKIQIESNGDRLLPALIPAHGQVWPFLDFLSIVVSPKVTNGKYKMLKQEVYQRATALKFVIAADPVSPYHDIPLYALNDFPREVYLSPMAAYRREPKPGEIASGWDHSLIDPEKTRANYAHAAALAMKYGKLLSIQSHLFASIA